MKLGHGEAPEALRRRGKIREVKRGGTEKMIKSEKENVERRQKLPVVGLAGMGWDGNEGEVAKAM